MPIVTTEQLIDCLSLNQTGDGRYEGRNLPLEYHRIFGGQLLAQIIAASALSIPDKQPKSLHVIFCREGSGDQPVEYVLDRHANGRTFATLAVTARQGDRVICTASVSMHVPDLVEFGHQHVSAPAARDVAEPVDLGMVPFETEIIGGVDLSSPAVEPAELTMSWKSPRLTADQYVHQALFAYATDLTLIGTALRPIDGVGQADAHSSLQTAVVSHTVWFHQPIDLAAGLVIDQHVPCLQHGRAFGLGHGFSAEGDLVASFAQESLVRPAPR